MLESTADSVELVGDRRILSKLSSMLSNEGHPLPDTLTALSSFFSDRLLHPGCVRRHCKCFLLQPDYNQNTKSLYVHYSLC